MVVDPLSDMINNMDRMKRSLELVRDARDDFRKAIKVIDEFNKNATRFIKVIEDLTDTMKRSEFTIRRLITQMENIDKNIETLTKLVDIASDILGDKYERKTK